MTIRPGAPMPDSLRHMIRARQAPACAIACPWCHARPHQACTTPSKRHAPPDPHQQRIAAWAQLIACCPECQVTPTVPCHRDGRALPNGSVHARRYQEAEEVAA